MNVFEIFASLGLDKTKYDADLEAAKASAEGMTNVESDLSLDTGEYDSGMADATQTAEDFNTNFLGLSQEASDTIAKYAKVLGSTLGTLAGAAIAKVFTNWVQDSAEAGKEIDLLSQRLGISRQAIQEWSYVLQFSNTDINDLGKGFDVLKQKIASWTAESGIAFEDYGLSIQALKAMSPDEVLTTVIAALQDMPEGAAKAQAATALFGDSADKLTTLLAGTSAATQDLKDELADSGLVMDDAAIENAVQYADAMTRLNETFKSLSTSTATTLMPFFEGVTNFITGGLRWLSENEGAVTAVLTVLAATFIAIAAVSAPVTTLIGGLGVATAALIGVLGSTTETTALESAVKSLGRAMETADETFEKASGAAAERKQAALDLLQIYDDLNAKPVKSDEDMADMAEIARQLAALYPELNASIDEHTGLLTADTDAIRANVNAYAEMAIQEAAADRLKKLGEAVAKATEDLRDNRIEMAQNAIELDRLNGAAASLQAMMDATDFGNFQSNLQAIYDVMDANGQQTVTNWFQQLSDGTWQLWEGADALSAYQAIMAALEVQYAGTASAAAGLETALDKQEQQAETLKQKQDEANAALAEGSAVYAEAAESATAYTDKTAAAAGATEDMANSAEGLNEKLASMDLTSEETAGKAADVGNFIVETAEAVSAAAAELDEAQTAAVDISANVETLAQAVVDRTTEIKAVIDTVCDYIEQRIAALLQRMNGYTSAFYSTGLNYANSLAAGIRAGQSAVSAAADAIVSAALSALNRLSARASSVSLRGYATGLPYVPYEMPVVVHPQEAILRADQAEKWRNGETETKGKAITAAEIAAAFKSTLAGMAVYLGTEKVGRIAEAETSRIQTDAILAGRFS